MAVELIDSELAPWHVLAAHEAAHPALRGRYGGTAVFIGTMRDFNQGETVQRMTLEHYPAMTRRHLEDLCDEARRRWEIEDALVVHRYGELAPGDPIVLVAVWSAHRAEALEACRYLIDELKTRAPFWKQEETDSGTRWVAPE